MPPSMTTTSAAAQPAPLKSTLLSQLDEYAELTQRLMASLQTVVERTLASDGPPSSQQSFAEALAGRPAPTSSQTDAIMQHLIALDAKLQASLDAVESHQSMQRRVAAAQSLSARLDAQMASLVRHLRTAELSLEAAVERGRARLAVMQCGNDGAASISDIIAYARRISYTTSAPPQYNSETDPMAPFMPPAPSEFQMTRSLLWPAAAPPAADLSRDLPRERTDAAAGQAVPTGAADDAMPTAQMTHAAAMGAADDDDYSLDLS